MKWKVTSLRSEPVVMPGKEGCIWFQSKGEEIEWKGSSVGGLTEECSCGNARVRGLYMVPIKVEEMKEG